MRDATGKAEKSPVGACRQRLSVPVPGVMCLQHEKHVKCVCTSRST